MCFGAPNSPVMYRKPVHTVEEIRPYWNGAFRTEEELPAIIEIIEAIPGSPEIEMRTVEVVVDYTPPKPDDVPMSATDRRYAAERINMITQSYGPQTSYGKLGSNIGVGTRPATPKPTNAMPPRQPAMESAIVEH